MIVFQMLTFSLSLIKEAGNIFNFGTGLWHYINMDLSKLFRLQAWSIYTNSSLALFLNAGMFVCARTLSGVPWLPLLLFEVNLDRLQ